MHCWLDNRHRRNLNSHNNASRKPIVHHQCIRCFNAAGLVVHMLSVGGMAAC